MLAAVTLRRTHAVLTVGAVVLFGLAIAQTGIGHLITDYGDNGLIAVHVPLAIVVTGVGVWLSLRATNVRRGVIAPVPQEAVTGRRSR